MTICQCGTKIRHDVLPGPHLLILFSTSGMTDWISSVCAMADAICCDSSLSHGVLNRQSRGSSYHHDTNRDGLLGQLLQ
jgi:hypothetical protein